MKQLNKVYPHFQLEVLLKLMRNNVDRFAKLDKRDDCIRYTLRENPKHKRHITLSTARRIYEDLYGDSGERFNSTTEFQELKARKHTRKGKAL